jgi:hypothetical protein
MKRLITIVPALGMLLVGLVVSAAMNLGAGSISWADSGMPEAEESGKVTSTGQQFLLPGSSGSSDSQGASSGDSGGDSGSGADSGTKKSSGATTIRLN